MTEPDRSHALARLGVATAATAVVLAACGGGSAQTPLSTGTGPAAVSSRSGAAQGDGPGGGFAEARPAASGEIAALSGSSMQVQNPTAGQVTVEYTTKTAFTQIVTVAKSAIAKGSCITAIGATGSGASSPSSTAFTATTITLSKATSGSCAIGSAGRTRPSGAPSGRALHSGRSPASGIPTAGRPSGPVGGRSIGQFTSGQVTSLATTGIVVHENARGTEPARDVQVTITASTKITEQVTATSTALRVGRCVSAQGAAASTGTVTATRVAITTPGANGCSAGFGGGRFGAGRGGSSGGA
jgi:hypothetical protein